MSLRAMFWTGVAVTCGPILICFATPKSAPSWILHVEDGVMLVEGILLVLLLLAVLVTPARVIDRAVERLAERAAHRREPVREVPAPNGMQALDTLLRSGEDGDSR